MTIEFHLPYQKVKEWVTDYVRTKLTDFHHLNETISRAEVFFKEEPAATSGTKKCEIELTVYGDSLFVSRSGESFEQASRDAIEALAVEVEKQANQNTEPPDTVTSTVEV